MQPQPNLDLNPAPSSTMAPERVPYYPRTAALGFVFSLTIASALHPDVELYRRITLQPIYSMGPNSTAAASVIKEALVQDYAIDPFDALLNEVHSQISEESWAKMPANFAGDIDRIVYGA